jgi:transcriptional regulator with XRE-family HTH domain
VVCLLDVLQDFVPRAQAAASETKKLTGLPVASAICRSRLIGMSIVPRSQRDTVIGSTPIASARSRCVNSRSARASLIRIPRLIGSRTVLGLLDLVKPRRYCHTVEVSTKTRHLRHLLRVAIGQEEIGRRIKQAREEAGLTQPELAERLNLRHPQSISKYERGLTEVSTHRLERIAEVTGKPISYFVQEIRGEQPEPESRAKDLSELQAAVERTEALLEQALRLLRDLEQGQRSGSTPPADVQELA